MRWTRLIVSTCASTDSVLPNYTETTEYGLSRDSSAPTARYGWLGSHRRDTGDALAQLTLLGARLHNLTTGRFLTVDPEPGGSADDYDYCDADAINCTDLDGRYPIHNPWLELANGIRHASRVDTVRQDSGEAAGDVPSSPVLPPR